MGATPQGKDITIEFDCQFRVGLSSSNFSSIMRAFLMLLPQPLCANISETLPPQ